MTVRKQIGPRKGTSVPELCDNFSLTLSRLARLAREGCRGGAVCSTLDGEPIHYEIVIKGGIITRRPVWKLLKLSVMKASGRGDLQAGS